MIPVKSIVLSKFDDIFRVFAASYRARIVSSPLLVIDDGLSEEIKEEYNEFEYVSGPKPFAFCLSVNLGMELAAPLDVIVWNDDIVIRTSDLDQRMYTHSQTYPEVGILVPLSTNVMNSDQRKKPDNSVQIKITQSDVGMGCGTYIPRRVINAVGMLDPEYRKGVIGREDRDYCCQVRAKGYSLAVAQNCRITHGGEEFGDITVSCTRRRIPGQMKQAVINRRYFNRKFGNGGEE